jgi:hypothetical protein
MASQPGEIRPSAATTLERARSLTNEAMLAVALQRRRLVTREPEDDNFVFRQWADFQFFLVALRRLRRAAAIAAGRPRVDTALRAFDAAVPYLAKLRNVGEHIDEYALASPKRRSRPTAAKAGVTPRDLQVGQWNESEWNWLGELVDVDRALKAAEGLHDAVLHGQRRPPLTGN